MRALVRLWRYFFPRYILHVTHDKKEYVVNVKRFTRKSTKVIAGVDTNDEHFEFVSANPLDYYIKENRDDLT